MSEEREPWLVPVNSLPPGFEPGEFVAPARSYGEKTAGGYVLMDDRPPAEAAPNPLRRVEWLDVGDDYPGHQVKLWLNPSSEAKSGLMSAAPTPEMLERARAICEGKSDDKGKPLDPVANATEQARLLALLKLCTLEHRVQPGGQPWQHPERPGPLPAPSTDEFWQTIPDDILMVVSARLMGEQKKGERRARLMFEPFTAGSPDSAAAAAQTGMPAASSPAAGTADPTR